MPSETLILDQLFAGFSPRQKTQAIRKIEQGIATLFEMEISTSLCHQNKDVDYQQVLQYTTSVFYRNIVNYPFKLKIMQALTRKNDRHPTTFVHDLAEICLLERFQRTEYVLNQDPTPPYWIEKLLIEYALKSRKLDKITSELTKSVCADRCDRPPVGCCHILGYDLGLVPKKMLELQILEAQHNGWTDSDRVDKCRFHTDCGCVLALFKSPACIGYLCIVLLDSLASRFGLQNIQDFVEDLARFRNCSIDRQEVFETMDKTLQSASRLLESPEVGSFS